LEDFVGDLALGGGRGEGGFGVGVVNFVALCGEEGAGVGVGDDGEDVVGGDAEEGVVECGGCHCWWLWWWCLSMGGEVYDKLVGCWLLERSGETEMEQVVKQALE